MDYNFSRCLATECPDDFTRSNAAQNGHDDNNEGMEIAVHDCDLNVVHESATPTRLSVKASKAGTNKIPAIDDASEVENGDCDCDMALEPTSAPVKRRRKAASKPRAKKPIRAPVAITPPAAMPHKKKGARTEAQRRAVLVSDFWTAAVAPHQVRCRGCKNIIKLDARSRYYPGLWEKHRERCEGVQKGRTESEAGSSEGSELEECWAAVEHTVYTPPESLPYQTSDGPYRTFGLGVGIRIIPTLRLPFSDSPSMPVRIINDLLRNSYCTFGLCAGIIPCDRSPRRRQNGVSFRILGQHQMYAYHRRVFRTIDPHLNPRLNCSRTLNMRCRRNYIFHEGGADVWTTVYKI
ncbi:hypothetical protein K438DRAFT_2055135 [Mycena galopus ATCC 62051]|nr:hypothetical protein K438DRAFT_2055135 [Mycena galopus ATCC 62051]